MAVSASILRSTLMMCSSNVADWGHTATHCNGLQGAHMTKAQNTQTAGCVSNHSQQHIVLL
jgi:hypothetical protein